MGSHKTKRLLVEGDEDRRVIPYLIEANGVQWGESRSEAIVDIAVSDGIENLLRPGLVETELKATGLEALGIVIDAGAISSVGRNHCSHRPTEGDFHATHSLRSSRPFRLDPRRLFGYRRAFGAQRTGRSEGHQR